jgi:tRNA threonylcarbamoyladenosine biosynthesis protein TsaE
MIRLMSHTEAETSAIAACVAQCLRPGDVLCLHGDLGAGKTRFVQGLAAALGCEQDAVLSPTFVLVHEYHGRLPLYHVDAYRLRDADEFLELGGEELLAGDGVCCIEWAERIAVVIPAEAIQIAIIPTAPQSREITIRWPAASADRWQPLHDTAAVVR